MKLSRSDRPLLAPAMFPDWLQALRGAPPLAAAMQTRILGWLSLLAVLTPGCASVRVDHDVLLATGDLAEVNVLLKQGDALTIGWSSSAALHFNVHTHAGAKVVESVASDGMGWAGSFTAPTGGAYSVFWQNQGSQQVSLHYAVTGAGILQSVVPA